MAVVEQDLVGDALYTYLTGNSTFNTAMGGDATTAGRVDLGYAQADRSMPYCVVTFIDGIAAGTMANDGLEFRIQLDIWDDLEAGPAAIAGHMDKLRLRLDRQRLTITSHNAITSEEDIVRGPLREQEAWRVSADYTVTVFRD